MMSHRKVLTESVDDFSVLGPQIIDLIDFFKNIFKIHSHIPVKGRYGKR